MLKRTLLLVALLFCASRRSASGYALEGPVQSGPSVAVRIQLGLSNRVLEDGSTSWNTVAESAFALWNDQMGRLHVNWTEAIPGTSASEGDGVTSIQFSSTIYGEAFDNNTLAITLIDSSGGRIIESDVLFNKKFHFDSYRGPTQFDTQGTVYDLRRIALHEFGHVLGLDHPDEANPPQHVNAIMNSRIDDIETLQSDDIAGIQALYGKPAGPKSDFNGDTNPDVLLQNSATGQRVVWLIHGTSRVGGAYLPTTSPLWSIVATGDLNGDGKTDIVFENGSALAVWEMNGLNYQSAVSLPALPPQWNVGSAADFNGDGKPDLLLQNSATGQRALWLMNGITHAGGAYLPTLSPQWNVVGTGDLNGDGKTDIIFQNGSALAAWLMNGLTYKAPVYFPSLPPQWNVAGAADFNSDGKSDLLLQNSATGQRAFWLMNGTARIGGAYLPTLSLQWDIRNH